MLTRFRTERRHGRDRLAAIHVASNTAGRAVFFSGLAVMISIGGLFLLDDPLFRSMAIGTISVVLVAVIGSLTFLPATLAILGDRVNRLRLPFLGRDREEGSGIWALVVRAVMRRPIIAAVAAAVLLLAMASPVLRLHMGQADFTSFPDTLDGVQAVNLLNEKWPGGSTLELVVVVTRADEAPTKAAIEQLTKAVARDPGISGPPKTFMSSDGHVAFVSYVMAGGSNDLRNQDIVRQVRSRSFPRRSAGLPGVRAYVTGDAAYTLDIVDFYANGMPLVMAFVLTLSFLLLLVAFRSIVIPIKAILLNLLSTGAAYGVLVLGLPGRLPSPSPRVQAGPDRGLHPGLHLHDPVRAVDGLPRLHPHPDQGGAGPRPAVERGGRPRHRDHVGTVTSAAAIMVVVFGVFVTLELDDHQAARARPRGRGVPRRDDRPEHPPAGDDAAAGRLELVAAALARLAAPRDDRGRDRRAEVVEPALAPDQGKQRINGPRIAPRAVRLPASRSPRYSVGGKGDPVDGGAGRSVLRGSTVVVHVE